MIEDTHTHTHTHTFHTFSEGDPEVSWKVLTNEREREMFKLLRCLADHIYVYISVCACAHNLLPHKESIYAEPFICELGKYNRLAHFLNITILCLHVLIFIHSCMHSIARFCK
jgi:hypothetical protein